MPNKSEENLRFLQLFVAGNEPNSLLAQKNLERIVRISGIDPAMVEVIDVYLNHRSAIENKIFLTPTLLIGLSDNVDRVVGNLQDVDGIVNQLQAAFHD